MKISISNYTSLWDNIECTFVIMISIMKWTELLDIVIIIEWITNVVHLIWLYFVMIIISHIITNIRKLMSSFWKYE